MSYTIKAHPTKYSGVTFRSRLEARWAAWFDLAEWKWEYEPLDLPGWTPDFLVTFPCGHSECGGRGSTHSLLVEVKPYLSIEQFKGHPCLDYAYGRNDKGETIPASASAAFGNNPDVVYWEMGHGAGGGEETDLSNWVYHKNVLELWKQAGEITRYRP